MMSPVRVNLTTKDCLFRLGLLAMLALLFSVVGCSTEHDLSSENLSIQSEEPVAEMQPDDTDSMGIISGRSPNALVRKSTVALLAGASLCSGTIISDKYVLTASHCVTNSANLSGWKVVFGANIYSTLSRPVVRVINDNVTASLLLPDIAIVEISGGLPSGYVAALLPTAQTPIATNSILTIAGYGRWSNTSTGSGILLQGSGTMLGSAKSHYILVGMSGQTQHCKGDSGGPTYVNEAGKMMVVGVTSHGAVPCTQGAYVTDVRKQRAWIRLKVGL
ncbi:MAG: hypothetical protein RLZZ488_649 [Pseudomonadota bacterium]|jgi:secreted trypsin-like serine protease